MPFASYDILIHVFKNHQDGEGRESCQVARAPPPPESIVYLSNDQPPCRIVFFF